MDNFVVIAAVAFLYVSRFRGDVCIFFLPFFYVNASYINSILFPSPCQHIFTSKHFLQLVALSVFMDPNWRSCTADAPRTKLGQTIGVLKGGAYYPGSQHAAYFLSRTVLKRDCRLPVWRATASDRRATHHHHHHHHHHHRRRRRPDSVVNKPYSHFLSYSHCISFPSLFLSLAILLPYIFLHCTPYIGTRSVQIFLLVQSPSPHVYINSALKLLLPLKYSFVMTKKYFSPIPLPSC